MLSNMGELNNISEKSCKLIMLNVLEKYISSKF